MSNEVLVSITDGIMTTTINRPEAKNAINSAVANGIAAAMEELDRNDDIQVAILTGAGGGFSSGMDLREFISGGLPIVKGRGFAGLVEKPPRKPLIAAVEGFALAGGLEIMISCDLVVVADNAKLGIPEVKIGLAAAGGGLMRLPVQIPERLAMEMALTGDFISPARAADVGLINRVVPEGTALEAAKKLAKTICANAPLGVRISKQVITASRDWSTAEMWEKQQAIVEPLLTSEDAIEGATAFTEKRAPNWKGN